MQHHDGGNVVHAPIESFNADEIVPFVASAAAQSASVKKLEEEIKRTIAERQDLLIEKLLDILFAPPAATHPFNSAYRGDLISSHGLSEYVCRKHGHHQTCIRMVALAAYTRVAINYHHARKRLRWEDLSKNLDLVTFYGDLRSRARMRYYNTDCDCGGLTVNMLNTTISSLPEKDDGFDNFVREYEFRR